MVWHRLFKSHLSLHWHILALLSGCFSTWGAGGSAAGQCWGAEVAPAALSSVLLSMSSNATRVGEAHLAPSSRTVSLGVQADPGGSVGEGRQLHLRPLAMRSLGPVLGSPAPVTAGCSPLKVIMTARYREWCGEGLLHCGGGIFRLGFAVINNENKIKWNRLFAERKVSLSWGLQGLESQQLKSQVLPMSGGCRWPLVPAWLRSSVLPAESQAFPWIWGNVCFLVNWKIMARSNFAGTAPHLQSSGHYIPSGLQNVAMVCPIGHRCWPRRPPPAAVASAQSKWDHFFGWPELGVSLAGFPLPRKLPGWKEVNVQEPNHWGVILGASGMSRMLLSTKHCCCLLGATSRQEGRTHPAPTHHGDSTHTQQPMARRRQAQCKIASNLSLLVAGYHQPPKAVSAFCKCLQKGRSWKLVGVIRKPNTPGGNNQRQL